MYNPIVFLIKQISVLIPFIIMFITLIKFKKISFKKYDTSKEFLLLINILPIFFIFLTSIVLRAKIRTMWMTPFYLFLGVFLYNFL